MPDIFISYSRKDSEHALLLAEQLRAEGLDVWIDRQGIAGAEQWATEIVEGINACSTFAILLSAHSIASDNVLRELSLASEKRKRLLPIALERVTLPSSFEYPLAGLQRVTITDFNAILRAHKHGVIKHVQKDARKSLMILPFEDHSPDGDNEWFANGIASELISALTNVKSLRVADQQATKDYKRYTGTLPVYARETDIRYFVQGDVRKFGDNIKITVRLLDIDTGDYLWQHAMKGAMENIFDIQEEVARNLLKGLEIHLSSDERRKLAERGTENAEAYQLFLKSVEYFCRQSKEGYRLSAQVCSEAIALDPNYAAAYQFKANALSNLYRSYDHDPALLTEAEALCKEALRLKPEYFLVYYPLSQIYLNQGRLQEAEETAQEYVRKAPDDFNSHFALGFFYSNTGQRAKAIASYEAAVRVKPDFREALFNLANNCHAIKDMEKCKHWSFMALPVHERYIRLHPDDEHCKVTYANLLAWSGHTDKARQAAYELKSVRDGSSLYNVACLFASLGEKQEALATFRMSIVAGFKVVRILKEFLTNDDDVAELAGTPEYEEVQQMIEQLEAKTAKKNA